MNREGKTVYFMCPEGADGPIKIGNSIWPVGRLRSHQAGSPVRLEIIAAAPGDCRHERALHDIFAVDRMHGEWFRASPALLALISRVIETGELPDDLKLPPAPKYWRIEDALQAFEKDRAA